MPYILCIRDSCTGFLEAIDLIERSLIRSGPDSDQSHVEHGSNTRQTQWKSGPFFFERLCEMGPFSPSLWDFPKWDRSHIIMMHTLDI